MRTMYETTSWNRTTIKTVQVEKETDKSVWINGNVHRKRSESSMNYFNTYQEAKDFLLKKATDKLRVAQATYDYARETLKKVEALKEENPFEEKECPYDHTYSCANYGECDKTVPNGVPYGGICENESGFVRKKNNQEANFVK